MLQDPALVWQLSWVYNNATAAAPHVDTVTGATLTSQSQSSVQISGSAPVNGEMPANVNVLGRFDTGLPDARRDNSTGPQSNLQLQFIALNGQMCSLKGTVPEGGPSPSPAQVRSLYSLSHKKASLCPA